MGAFFGIFASVCTLLLFASVGLGHMGAAFSSHLMLGMTAVIGAVLAHCLVFAIFTGSGKDTRLLVEDLELQGDWVKRTKTFKRTVFPPALYAIFFLILLAVLGGLLSRHLANPWVRWGHALLAWFTLYYNVKTFWLEYKAILENGEILKNVNAAATDRLVKTPTRVDQVPEEIEWGTHVFALGKFLCFMGYNVWLFYLYFRFIMSVFTTPFWPFAIASAVFLSGGYYLRWRYAPYRPVIDQSGA